MTLPLFLAVLSIAHAGSLYVNGVRGDSLRDQEFKNVNVRIDANGDIYVDAKNYTIKVNEPTPTNAPPPSSAAGVAAGHYWLITEDNASAGHTVEVRVNGVVVRTIRSGDPQIILDLAQFLRPGENQVTMAALPAPVAPSGGVLHLYVGPGSNDNGVVRVDAPPIDFQRRSSDSASGKTQTYTLKVE